MSYSIFTILFLGAFISNSESVLKNSIISKPLQKHNSISKPLDTLGMFSKPINTTTNNDLTPCTCGVFLNGQLKKGASEPKGNPALQSEIEILFPCNTPGFKLCQNRCLDSIVKHLPNSPTIICGSIDRDVYKERAYLFIKNCSPKWTNTNLSAGREYCCKNGEFYKCPMRL